MKKGFALLLIWLAGCQGVDTPATLIAQNNSYATEVVTINQTLVARRTEVVATAQVAETQVAQIEAVNRQWLNLLMAGVTPTPGVVAGVAPPEAYSGTAIAGGFSEQYVGANQVDTIDDPQRPATDGSMTAAPSQFVDIGTALYVRESDGCIDAPQNVFTPDTTRIYLGARALTITTGTVMQVDWSLEGQVVWQDSWTVPQDQTNFCLWFYLGPEYTALTPGNWSAQLYADGIAISPAAAFVIATP